MTSQPPRDEGEREPRVPLYVRIITQPAIHDIWAINISPTGIGLVAAAWKGGLEPREGDEIELEFPLPGISDEISARGEITWRYDTPTPKDGGVSLSLGVRFNNLPDDVHLRLTRYCHTYRFRALVAYASADEISLIEAALGEDVLLSFADSEKSVTAGLARGDVSVLVVCGDDERRAATAIERAAVVTVPSELAGVSMTHDLTPRVIHCAAATEGDLVRQFNRGMLFRRAERPLEAEPLREAVLQACSDYGVRTEQRRVALALERALLRERARDRSTAQLEGLMSDRLIYRSTQMAAVLEALRTVAPHKVGVLLQGETGVGKEVVARLLHDLGDRTDAPFIVQDCGVMTESLLESELFGHVKGAFTGAVADNPGLFVIADTGTVFLDEIENTSPSLQAKLLRVIETGEVRPVGSSEVRYVDVRILAASNRSLVDEMQAGRFRADLYFRLSTFPITIPALRDRPDDIMPLAKHFLAISNSTLGREIAGFTTQAEAALLGHRWPGNVRELRNVIERAVLLGDTGRPIRPELLFGDQTTGDGGGAAQTVGGSTLRDRLASVERQMIRDALERHDGVLRRAARELGVSAVTLGRKARRLGVWKPDAS